jgi:flagellar basal-body rod modification protein FlgD
MAIGSATDAAATATNQTSKATNSLAGLADNFNNFLTLLTTQLQHQDPLSPLDSNKFTSELVQFTGVEQQVLQNKNLEQLITLQSTNQSLAATNFIGKSVEATGNTNMLTNGQATFTYVLPKAADSAALQIFDSTGKLVYEQAVDKEAGLHDFVWDGTTLDGGTAPDGAYNYSVTALDDKQDPITVDQRVVGTVTGVSMENGETVLGIGDVGVPLSAVTGVQNTTSTSS